MTEEVWQKVLQESLASEGGERDPGIILLRSWASSVLRLNQREKAALLDALYYDLLGIETEVKTGRALGLLLPQILGAQRVNRRKYYERRERCRRNGLAGGRPRND